MEGFVRGIRAMLQQVRTIRAEKGEAAANAQYSDFVSRIFMMDMLLNEKSASKLGILTQGRPVDLAVFDDDIKAKSKAVLDLACPS
ncbi:MAG: hypothetical protein M1825_004585 [Sarcosagium campestre]|nr:MAG: hypothetical protein M1825_004585 [Sarcosagium campestre]